VVFAGSEVKVVESKVVVFAGNEVKMVESRVVVFAGSEVKVVESRVVVGKQLAGGGIDDKLAIEGVGLFGFKFSSIILHSNMIMTLLNKINKITLKFLTPTYKSKINNPMLIVRDHSIHLK